MAGGHAWPGACVVGVCGWGHAWQGAMCVGGGVCMAEETATGVDGTHPTGMHSCMLNVSY